MIWLTIAAVTLLFWGVGRFLLNGPDLSAFDQINFDIRAAHPDDTQANRETLNEFRDIKADVIATRSLSKGFAAVRHFADNLSSELDSDSIFKQIKTDSVDIEWCITPGADPKRRVVFVHGGAFILGSAKGHRYFSDRLSRILGAAVASVNYRMLPENGRKASIIDCQNAYRWVLEHGPDGKEELDYLLVSGDSAGGNLSLMLSSWSRDEGLRMPDSIVAFSPSADMTMSSPTIKEHRQSDRILGPSLGLLSSLPKALRGWLGLLSLRMNPANTLASPVFGDLNELPPTLIHASSNEMLLGEAIRYTNKAVSQGSQVKLQVWENQLHDWHLFNIGHGSAEDAWAEVARFLSEVKKARTQPLSSAA